MEIRTSMFELTLDLRGTSTVLLGSPGDSVQQSSLYSVNIRHRFADEVTLPQFKLQPTLWASSSDHRLIMH